MFDEFFGTELSTGISIEVIQETYNSEKKLEQFISEEQNSQIEAITALTDLTLSIGFSSNVIASFFFAGILQLLCRVTVDPSVRSL